MQLARAIKKRCALIVLENITPRGEQAKCFLKDLFVSEKFEEHFGELGIPDELGFTWPLCSGLLFRKEIPSRRGNVY